MLTSGTFSNCPPAVGRQTVSVLRTNVSQACRGSLLPARAVIPFSSICSTSAREGGLLGPNVAFVVTTTTFAFGFSPWSASAPKGRASAPAVRAEHCTNWRRVSRAASAGFESVSVVFACSSLAIGPLSPFTLLMYSAEQLLRVSSARTLRRAKQGFHLAAFPGLRGAQQSLRLPRLLRTLAQGLQALLCSDSEFTCCLALGVLKFGGQSFDPLQDA